jgi:hypothetical protein
MSNPASVAKGSRKKAGARARSSGQKKDSSLAVCQPQIASSFDADFKIVFVPFDR